MTTKTQNPPIEALDFDSKINRLKKMFSQLESTEKRYHLLIDLGKTLPLLEETYKTKENLVKGCQSLLYIHAFASDDKIFFKASSDALISKGLAALMLYVYNGESSQTILQNPPFFLEELGLYAALSPNRSQGLYHIYLKIRELSLIPN